MRVTVNLRPNIKKSFRVLLTSLLYLLFYGVLQYFLSKIIQSYSSWIALFITFVITIFFYEQITWAVRNFIDRNFYRKIFAINQSLNGFNVELNSTLDFQKLIEKFIAFLGKAFRQNTWSFYYCWGEEYELFSTNDSEIGVPKLIKLPGDRELDQIFKNEIDFFNLEKLRDRNPEFDQALGIFPKCGAYTYFYPLKSYKGYLGFVTFDKSFRYYLHFASIRKMLLRIFNKTADVLENSWLYSEVERKSLQNLLLVEIGKKISSTLELNEVLESIMDSVTQLVRYDAGGIFLIDDDARVLRRMVTRGYDKELLDKLSLKLNLGIYGQVIRTKAASIINDVTRDPNYYSVRRSTSSQLTVPLLNGDKVLGVMALESDHLNHFTPADRELLITFAGQAEIAIENAQLFEASTQKKRLESELVVASKVQKALLPERPPDFPGFEICFMNIPSRIVGGDFYDIFKLGESKLALAIGDVSGKGAPASILMAMLYAGFRSLLKVIYPVVEVVARLNNLLTETTAVGYFATFFFGIYNRNSSDLTYTNAGHDPPVLIRRDGSVYRLQTGGVVLGFLKDQEYKQESIKLAPGDFLVLFTDGVTEVKNSAGEEFGDQRLIQFIKSHMDKNPQDLKGLLFDELKSFNTEADLEDDATFAIIHVK
jgi:sigma-B regulation protein RsbU (phosphoserine phosphatase)